MTQYFAKPENALKRACELIEIDCKNEALVLLHGMITNKRHRQWSQTMENLVFKYIDLCIEQRRSKTVKDGLHQYKNLCQNVNISSLEKVVKYFLLNAEKKAKDAENKAEQIVVQIDDSEDKESVESAFLTSVSGEDSKDRTDRSLVTPWLKFLFETYRTVLEILRNFSKLEIYQSTAQKAFGFCLRYHRNTEFKKLSEILRTHLNSMNKYSQNEFPSADSIHLHLDTHFTQLKVATQLELWQEAFRTLEDIHGLFLLTGQYPHSELACTYLSKVAELFLAGSNHLLHAISCQKLYFAALELHEEKAVSKAKDGSHPQQDDDEEEDTSFEELRFLATQALLALVIPLTEPASPPPEFEFNSVKREKELRLFNLVWFEAPTNFPLSLPTAPELLADLRKCPSFDGHVVPELRDVHDVLVFDFDPPSFTTKLLPKLDAMKSIARLTYFVKPIEKVAVLQLCRQLSKVYDSIYIEEFVRLGSYPNFTDVEPIIADAATKGLLNISIHHQKGIIKFNSNLLLYPDDNTCSSSRFHLELTRIGNTLSSLFDQTHDDTLTLLGKRKRISRKEEVVSIQEEAANFTCAIAQRKKMIEDFKEDNEKKARDAAASAEAERLRVAREKEEAEKARVAKMQEETSIRQAQRAQKERQVTQILKHLKDTGQDDLVGLDLNLGVVGGGSVLETASTVPTGKKQKTAQELLSDPDKLLKQALMKEENNKQGWIIKMKKLSKKLDWIERAKRDKERPLLLSKFQKDNEKVKIEQEKKAEIFLTNHKKQWEHDMREKKRLERLLPFKAAFQKQLYGKRENDYKEAVSARERKLKIKRKEEITRLKEVHRRKKRREEDEKREIEKRQLSQERERQEQAAREEEERRNQEREREMELEREKERDKEQERGSGGRLERVQDQEPEIPQPWRPSHPPGGPGFSHSRWGDRERDLQDDRDRDWRGPRDRPPRDRDPRDWRDNRDPRDWRDRDPRDRDPRDRDPRDRDPRDRDPRDRDPRDRDPRDRDPRDRDPRDRDPRDRDPRDRDPRDRDPRDRDPRDYPRDRDSRDRNPRDRDQSRDWRDPRERDPRERDPRERDPRERDPREQDPRERDPRERDPRDWDRENRDWRDRDTYPSRNRPRLPPSPRGEPPSDRWGRRDEGNWRERERDRDRVNWRDNRDKDPRERDDRRSGDQPEVQPARSPLQRGLDSRESPSQRWRRDERPPLRDEKPLSPRDQTFRQSDSQSAPEPEEDDDGFQKVVHSKRGKRANRP